MRLDYRQRVESIRSTVSLQAMLEQDGHKVSRIGGYFRLCCPFHSEKTPSCFVYPDHIHCFGCATHVDIFGYIMKRDGCDFKRAMEILSGNLPTIPMPVQKRVIERRREPEMPESYFREKMDRWRKDTSGEEISMFADSIGVLREPLIALDVAWADEHQAWAIPMRNSARKVIGIRLRSNQGEKWAVKGSKQGLFIPIGKPSPDLIVTEGPTDCAAALSIGFFAIGKPQAMASTYEVLKFVRMNKVRRVIVIADNDHAGLKGADKLIGVCPVPTCELVLPTKDMRAFVNTGGTRAIFETMLMNQLWKSNNQGR